MLESRAAGHRHSLRCAVYLNHVQLLAQVKTTPRECVQCLEHGLESEGLEPQLFRKSQPQIWDLGWVCVSGALSVTWSQLQMSHPAVCAAGRVLSE